MEARRSVHPIVAVSAILLILIPLVYMTSFANSREITIHILHARMGPVYQRLTDNTTIEVYADIYYPDTLYLRPPNILGVVNVTVHVNWTGPWDGIITIQVVDPGYRIDPTLFKPVESMWEWGEGGAVIGSGALHAAIRPVYENTVTRQISIIAHERYFNATPGVHEAQYFFKIRLALFDNETGQKIPGGDINIYTTSDTAPTVNIVVVREEGRDNNTMLTSMLLNVALAVGAALAIYTVADYIYSRRKK
ncbi:hypothetical protein Pyrfu_0789 [Pyrolobus fumarii 1A]|uniref:Uncharacterized protein n=1 Tax=Pyrolobus fumarii (strain DSM 11204 / 1A) TaxID=694429 RepID=G0EDH3_PYRF1|nr:hypothetical protein [Pyrolobus fumarii]AEM38658.1 hypothetical protein Pyrfu_0789 [Pyrolobus fumarii 1A]